ncbi:MAG: alpha-amylase family glycosyl hydrolase [Petrotogales bacterium]
MTLLKKTDISKNRRMGAIPHESGTFFRVWAPNADRVSVAGDFNKWQEDVNPLEKEENGVWSTDVDNAKPGEEYKFIIFKGDRSFMKNDPYARWLTGSTGNSIIYDTNFNWGDFEFSAPKWNEMVIYEMHIGTFNKENREKPGTFKTAIKKLKYLNELGINIIEIMPPFEFPMDYSWGYNPSYIFSIETAYGGPHDFKLFVKEAHKLGIGIIIDVVYNHFGPNDLDIWRFDGWYENDGGGIYFYNDWHAETSWGKTRPNYSVPEVRKYIKDNVFTWLNEFRIDGLRWDATAYIRNVYGNDSGEGDLPEGWSLMSEINKEIEEKQPWKISIAEDLKNNEYITSKSGEDDPSFDAQWDIDFVYKLRNAIVNHNDEERDMHSVAEAIGHRFNNDAFRRIIYTESHDEVAKSGARFPARINPDNVRSWYAKKRTTVASSLIFCSPGVPMIFQGQEFYDVDKFSDKTPIDWTSRNKYKGMVNFHKDLIKLRRNSEGITKGLSSQNIDVYHVNNKDKIIAFHRWENIRPMDSTVIIVNLANKKMENYQIGFPEEGIWKVRFNSDSKKYDDEFGDFGSEEVNCSSGEYDNMPYSGNISIAPYSVLILSQDK